VHVRLHKFYRQEIRFNITQVEHNQSKKRRKQIKVEDIGIAFAGKIKGKEGKKQLGIENNGKEENIIYRQEHH
jgi:hypothetical protein